MGTDDAMFKRKGNIVLLTNKYSFAQQLALFWYSRNVCFAWQCATDG